MRIPKIATIVVGLLIGLTVIVVTYDWFVGTLKILWISFNALLWVVVVPSLLWGLRQKKPQDEW